MSTSYAERPMKAVFTPRDVTDVRNHLARQKSLMGALLSTRDAVGHAISGAPAALGRLLSDAKLGWAVAAARRVSGWVGGLGAVTLRSLRTPGIRPGLAWLALTPTGQQVARHVANTTKDLLALAARTTWRVVSTGLRLAGRPGAAAADWTESRLNGLTSRLVKPMNTLQECAGAFLTPSGVLVQAMRSLAMARALSALVRLALPSRSGLVLRAVAGFVSLPGWVRVEVYKLFARTSASPRPDDDPTPAGKVVPIKAPVTSDPETAATEPPVVHQPHPSMAKYPAKRTSNARKRR